MRKSSAMQTFVENLIRIRKDRGLSQHDLAELLGTKQPSISRVERGEEDISLSRADEFARALGFTLSEMVAPQKFSKIA